MSFSYRYLPDVAIADIAFEAEADTIPELFEACGLALTDVLVDRSTLNFLVSRDFEVENDSLETCLHMWLEELVYCKDVDGLLAKEFSLRYGDRQTASHVHLLATVWGESIDRSRHLLGQDVKAVTYHLFQAVEVNGRFHARVVLDI